MKRISATPVLAACLLAVLALSCGDHQGDRERRSRARVFLPPVKFTRVGILRRGMKSPSKEPSTAMRMLREEG